MPYLTQGGMSKTPQTGILRYLTGRAGPSGFGSRSTAAEVVAEWDGEGRVAIVTGGNTGLGKESATALASKGCEVILAVRNLTKGEEAVKTIVAKHPAAKVSAKRLDLASLSSVRAFAADFKASGKPLHILMCNAGVMSCPFMTSVDSHELQFATNHLGHFLLVNLLLDNLIAGAQALSQELDEPVTSRVVLLSSAAHFNPYTPDKGGPILLDRIDSEDGYNAWYAYGQSKLCNLLHARELHKGLSGHNVPVTAVACHPGVIPTELFRHMNLNPILTCLLRLLLGWALKSVPQGAATQTYLATAEGVKSGEYYADCNISPSTADSHDDELGGKLWDLSEAFVTK